MPQDLTQLPKTADVDIAGCDIHIHNHKVVTADGLFGPIMYIVTWSDLPKNELVKFEKHGISYEAAIECCVLNLEKDAEVLTDLIYHDYDMKRVSKNGTDSNWNDLHIFSKSVAGRIIAGQFVEKIRSCDNWEELYNELHLTSKFSTDMKNKIKREMEQQCRKV